MKIVNKGLEQTIIRFSTTYTEFNSFYCRRTAIRMKFLPEHLDCIVSKCFLHRGELTSEVKLNIHTNRNNVLEQVEKFSKEASIKSSTNIRLGVCYSLLTQLQR